MHSADCPALPSLIPDCGIGLPIQLPPQLGDQTPNTGRSVPWRGVDLTGSPPRPGCKMLHGRTRCARKISPPLISRHSGRLCNNWPGEECRVPRNTAKDKAEEAIDVYFSPSAWDERLASSSEYGLGHVPTVSTGTSSTRTRPSYRRRMAECGTTYNPRDTLCTLTLKVRRNLRRVRACTLCCFFLPGQRPNTKLPCTA
jgi:hypothetical protein